RGSVSSPSPPAPATAGASAGPIRESAAWAGPVAPAPPAGALRARRVLADAARAAGGPLPLLPVLSPLPARPPPAPSAAAPPPPALPAEGVLRGAYDPWERL